MIAFYNDIFKITKDCGDENMRNQKIAEFVASWFTKNKKALTA